MSKAASGKVTKKINATTKKKKPSIQAKARKANANPKEMEMPKELFEEVMQILNDDHDYCEEYFKPRCSVPIQNISVTHRNCFKNPKWKLLEEARLCLMQRDWTNMAKVMTLINMCSKDHILCFQVFVRYGAIFLAHNKDEYLMDMFLKGVVGIKNDVEKDQFFRSLTND